MNRDKGLYRLQRIPTQSQTTDVIQSIIIPIILVQSALDQLWRNTFWLGEC